MGAEANREGADAFAANVSPIVRQISAAAVLSPNSAMLAQRRFRRDPCRPGVRWVTGLSGAEVVRDQIEQMGGSSQIFQGDLSEKGHARRLVTQVLQTYEQIDILVNNAGITRDRIHGQARFDGRQFEVIDTGGIVIHDSEYIPSQILKQARFALDTAAQVIFLIDGRTEITGTDRELAAILRKIGKPVTLVVNKIDSTRREDLAHEFHALPIIGMDQVVSMVAQRFDGLHLHSRRQRTWSVDEIEVEVAGVQ